MIIAFFLLTLLPHLLEGLDIKPSSPRSYPTTDSLSRRSFITSAVAATTSTAIVSPANAATTVECLKDLPPLSPHKIRLFLCRHGETEYNRLGLVQGARIDAELNPMGELQAARLGQALSLSAEHPTLFVHSPLKRTKQTASIATAQYTKLRPSLKMLPDIAEVDFGSVMDGGNIMSNSVSMASTYEAWALGDLDAKMTADGESLRQVLDRVSRSLYQLQNMAPSASRSVVVVSHSSFLKLFLATCQDANILDMRNVLKIGNCCVNVIDIPTAKDSVLTKITSASPVLGSPFSKAPPDYSLVLPKSGIVRLNEQRHLIGL